MMEKYWYDKDASRLISGVAILLMLAHHYFGFRHYLRPDVDWISLGQVANIEIERFVAVFGKICVALYAFNSGYVLWVRRSDFTSFKKRMVRLLNFLFSYWIICLLFLLLGYLFGDRMPTCSQLALNLLGFQTGPNTWVNVPFAWYVSYYILYIIVAPAILWLFRGGSCWMDILKLALAIVITYMIARIPYMSELCAPLRISIYAALIAKWHLFERCTGFMAKVPFACLLAILPLIALFRQAYQLMFFSTYLGKISWGGE